MCEKSQEELDEAVHEAKAEEAAAINNKGREAQLAYLGEDQSNRVIIFVKGGCCQWVASDRDDIEIVLVDGDNDSVSEGDILYGDPDEFLYSISIGPPDCKLDKVAQGIVAAIAQCERGEPTPIEDISKEAV